VDVLQIGPENWADKYSIPSEIKWHYNSFATEAKEKSSSLNKYSVVVITGKNNMTDEDWKKLQWVVAPYTVLYLPWIKDQLTAAAKRFLVLQASKKIELEPQELIDRLLSYFFDGQSGIRYAPTQLMITNKAINEFEYLDSGHLKITLDTNDEWVNVGTYKNNFYIDPDRIFKIWLSLRTLNIKIRLRIYPALSGQDGEVSNFEILNIDPKQSKEYMLKLTTSKVVRMACVNVEAKGNGAFILGVLHWRWSRGGNGSFIAGGKRIVDQVNHDDIAYYLNPGDMKPPLNVYFSGARALEGFEAYPLFRKMHAPSLLFTDMRLGIGEFYDDASQNLGLKIKEVIDESLKKLGFSRDQLLMNGISMGTYPALKYGAQIQAHAIIIAKPIANLGYVATRQRLERPDEFDTIFDIDNQFINSLDEKHLKELDHNFWQQFEQNDLSKTKLFIGYMENDDYDNRAVEKIKKTQAIKSAKQIIYKGYPGRHNDNPAVTNWFIERVHQIMRTDFNRDI
jgi:accessory secretory protein Asp2